MYLEDSRRGGETDLLRYPVVSVYDAWTSIQPSWGRDGSCIVLSARVKEATARC